MSRHVSGLKLAFTLCLLALGACDESTTPTEPQEHASPAAAAAVGYLAQDINIPFPVEGGSASSINAAGQVVGTSFLGRPFDVWSGWIWKSGTGTRLGTLGGANSWAQDINDLGQVVGYSENARGKIRAFRWVNGTMTGIGTLGGSVSRALAINNKGHIVGHSQLTGDPRDPNGAPFVHAFLKKSGVMTDLGTLGGRNSTALDINDAGQVVGWSETAAGIRHPFLWQNGVMQDLLAGSADSGTAHAINPFGVVVGERNRRAFRYSGGIMRNLPLGSTPRSVATGIRNGRIVGSLMTPTGGRGFVLADGQVTLLPLLNPAADVGDEEDNAASDINGAGVIVGETTQFQSNGSPTMWSPQ